MQYDFNLGANQSVNFDVKGSFIRYKSGTGTIRVKLNGGGFIDMLPGQGIRGVSFNTISLQDRTGSQNAGFILAGDYEFTDDTITGTVDVIDGGKKRVFAGQAFMGYTGTAGTATLYAGAQLWNPVGSGKRLVVEQLDMYSDSSTVVLIAPETVQSAVVRMQGYSKRSNLTQGVGLVCGEQRVARPANGWAAFSLSTGSTVSFKPTEPFVIEPGFGLSVCASAASTAGVTASFEWFEEALF